MTVTVFWPPHSEHGWLTGQLGVGPHSCHAVVVDHTVACPEQLDPTLMSTAMEAARASGAAVELLKRGLRALTSRNSITPLARTAVVNLIVNGRPRSLAKRMEGHIRSPW
jgi:hypothetical protein